MCTAHDSEVYDVKDMEQGVNSPMFHPNCRYIDRRDLEIALLDFEAKKKVEELGAKTDIKSEIGRVKKNGKGWEKVSLGEVLYKFKGKPDSGKINESGEKVLFETEKKNIIIVYSPSGSYYKIA